MSGRLLGTRLLGSKFYLLCYAALLKNYTYYTQIMFTEIEQFPDIFFQNSHVLFANLHFYR